MPSVSEIKPIAKAVKAWAEAELGRVQQEKAKLEKILEREGKYQEMQDLVTQAQGE